MVTRETSGALKLGAMTLLVSAVTAMAVLEADRDLYPPIDAHPRYKQMFPVLAEAEIERIGRFGTLRRYARGDRLVAAGEKGPGCSSC